MTSNHQPTLLPNVPYRRFVFLGAAVQIPGVLVALLLLYQPNPHTLALFFFVGIPLIIIGFGIYAAMILQAFRRSGLL